MQIQQVAILISKYLISVQDLIEKLSVAIIEELEEILFTWHSKLLWLSHYEVSGNSVVTVCFWNIEFSDIAGGEKSLSC